MLAVMPFENLTGDPREEYFSDGFTEEMITQLGSLDSEQLGVIARTSAMQYKNARKGTKQIGYELGVDYILEGSVRRAGDHVRISAQLIEVREQTHLWAKQYDREQRDVLALQGDVARAIADEINLNLTAKQKARLARVAPVNTEAYNDYLKGRYEWNRRTPKSVDNSITYYLKAAQADPNYALAYAGLADSYNILGNLGLLPPKEAYPRAMAAANQALGLDRELPQAESALALATCLYQWDWFNAEKGFRRAIELNPSYGPTHQWYAICLVSRGRSDEAIAEMKLAMQAEPDSMIINAVGAWVDFLAGKYDEGIQQAQNTLGLDPNFERARIYLGMNLGQKGLYADAIAELQKLPHESTGPFMLAALGYVYARAGEKVKADQVLQEMKDQQRKGYFPATDLALVYSGLGEKDEAFKWLQKAYEERDPWLIHLQAEPRLAALRSNSRFRTLVRRIGLPSGNAP
jgi:TolB-like protein/Tfp pilus assembly protein PilF